jgi:hypothetical protein
VNLVAAVSACSTPAPIASAAVPADPPEAAPADAPESVTPSSVTVAFVQDSRGGRG